MHVITQAVLIPNEAGDIDTLLTSDFVDFDCPDPALYPKGMLLWNLRRSGFNVKRFERNYINTADNNVRFGSWRWRIHAKLLCTSGNRIR